MTPAQETAALERGQREKGKTVLQLGLTQAPTSRRVSAGVVESKQARNGI